MATTRTPGITVPADGRRFIGRAGVRLSCGVALHASHLRLESLLGLFLCDAADAKADAYPEIPLVYESAAVREDGDT